MRVLFVTKPLSPPWDDGAKLVPRDLARAAAGRFEPVVLGAASAAAEWGPGVVAHPIFADSGRYRPGAGQQLRLLRAVWSLRHSVDVLHFFFQPHPRACRVAAALSAACRLPAVHTALAAPAPGVAPRRLRFAQRTVTLSRATASLLPGEPPAVVIPPALHDLAPRPDGEPALEVLGVERPFVLYPGDYEFSGGHELLLEVWAANRGLPDLVITGRDKTAAAAGARERLAARAVSLGVASRVRLLGAVADLSAWISACRGLLFPATSLYAKLDLPWVVLEAWRESKPVLVADLPPLAEAVQDAGAVLPARAPAWAEAVAALAERGESWGRAGRARLLSHFAASAAAEAYAALYAELLSNRRAA